MAFHTETTSLTTQSETDRIRQTFGPYDDIFKHGKETQVKVVWVCIKISRACQNNFTRENARREKWPTKEALHWENNISEWTGLMFRDAVIESENKIK